MYVGVGALKGTYPIISYIYYTSKDISRLGRDIFRCYNIDYSMLHILQPPVKGVVVYVMSI